MKRNVREALEAAQEEGKRHGVTVSLVRDTAHNIFEVKVPSGEHRHFAVSVTPRTDSPKNWARQNVRQCARKLGVLK